MKIRLDQVLVERGLAVSKSKAQAMIMAGLVHLGTKQAQKPGQLVASDIQVNIKETPKYVSRAGEKLGSVAGTLKLDFNNKIVLDVGSSTGGFTDYALQSGAAKVYAVDVGNNQLAYKLRQDRRVVSMERTDIRDVKELPDKIDIALADVSFISLTKVLPGIVSLLAQRAVVVAMAKPQFEAGKAIADKFRGVIADEEVRAQVLSEFEQKISKDFKIIDSVDSAVPGAKGNIERFYKLVANS